MRSMSTAVGRGPFPSSPAASNIMSTWS
jgi:hypothetical protein